MNRASNHQDAGLSRYIERVRALPKLTREVEHDLAVRARAGDQSAVDGLVEANLRYAVAVALQYRRYGLRLGDLIAEGNLGLMMAVRKFDPDRGTRFVTYAGYWIRALVLDFVVRSASLVGAGSGPFRSKIYFRLRRERAKVANLVVDPEERNAILAKSFGVTNDRMAELVQRLDGHDVSLDAPVFDDSAASLVDTMTDDATPADERVYEEQRDTAVKNLLARALGVLDERERYIVEKRIMSDDEVSLAALGRKLGVSRERARQLEARAKKKLRKELAAAHVDEALLLAS